MSNFEYMLLLRDRQRKEGKKKIWVYYKFIEKPPEGVWKSDFHKLAKILGYNPVWADIKRKNWKKDLIRIKKQKEEFIRAKVLDERYKRGFDLPENKDF